MGKLKLRAIDRVVLAVMGTLVTLIGFYLVGPWYLDTSPDGYIAPLYYLLEGKVYVVGVLHLIFGTGLLITLFKWQRWLPWMILGCFLVRFYTLMGVFAVATFLPPTYIQHITTVCILGAYWLYIRINARY